MTNRNLILHPAFVVSLAILVLNDFCLKQALANDITGKLSDFAGLVVFPLLVVHLVPPARRWIAVLTGLLFLAWKTPLADALIGFVNAYLPFHIHRVIDYTDYWALMALPPVHWMVNRYSFDARAKGLLRRLTARALLVVSVFAVTATTMAPPIELPQGTIHIGKRYTIQKSKEETVALIRSMGYNVSYHENLPDSTWPRRFGGKRMPYYQTDSIVIDAGNPRLRDTIVNVKYTLYEPVKGKTKIEIINVTLSGQGNIQRWQTLKYLRREYRKLLKKHMITELKDAD